MVLVWDEKCCCGRVVVIQFAEWTGRRVEVGVKVRYVVRRKRRVVVVGVMKMKQRSVVMGHLC